MLTLQDATALAAWANTHDGGVDMPRADVVPTSIPDRFAVEIRSLSVVTSGSHRWTEVDTETAYSQRGAARILGY